MSVPAALLELLVDPDDKQPLTYFADEAVLYNPRAKRRYDVRDNKIPVLLLDAATVVSEEEHARLIAKQGVLTGSPRTGSPREELHD